MLLCKLVEGDLLFPAHAAGASGGGPVRLAVRRICHVVVLAALATGDAAPKLLFEGSGCVLALTLGGVIPPHLVRALTWVLVVGLLLEW